MNRVIQRLVRYQLLEPRVLPLELLEPLGLVQPQAAILLPPPVVGLLADPDLLAHLRDAQPTAKLHLALPQLADDLFRAVPLGGYLAASFRPRSYGWIWTGLRGTGQVRRRRLLQGRAKGR